ncbi:MAG: flagellar hook-associated protein FlgL [Synergistaceae bacterium]|nr:flagellar hook-associated protein FlgL [Synergistaceae bacterium]
MYSRLTTATMYGSLMDSLLKSQRNIQDLQRQIASGDKYTNLTENPSAVARSLAMQSAMKANDKYTQNTTNAITMLRYADSAMNNVLDAAQAIRSLIIQAGDGSLDSSQLKDITAQIEANKKIMLDNLNTKVAGQYIFGGTDTTTRPFVEQSDGSITYQGSDERIKYAVNDGLLGDVGFAGNDIVQENDDSYFICSHYVPLNWEWTGREEKVQITVGNRTLSVFIPEDWNDYNTRKTSTDYSNSTDYNRFRDPDEHTGISLDDLAEIVNRSLEEQGADMLVHVTVEKDSEKGVQQLIMKSNTGEKIGITGWPDTDYMPMPASITTKEFDADNVSWKLNGNGPNGLMGKNNILSWKGSSASGDITITAGSKTATFDLTTIDSSTDLVTAINREFSGSEDGTPFASFSTGNLKGRLVLQNDIQEEITVSGTGIEEIFGISDPITSTSASFTVQTGDDAVTKSKIFINKDDTLDDVAEKVNSIEGVVARTSADGKSITIVAQKTGTASTDRLANNDAAEEMYCPSLIIQAEKPKNEAYINEASALFNFEDGSTILKATSERRQLDHSHIDIFDALGMETAMKSREFDPQEKLTVEAGTELHWRVMSGGRYADIKLNSGDYTLQEVADRLKNAGSGWIEVTLEEDSTEKALTASGTDSETATQRLVIRGFNGEEVLFLDMNEYNYADQLGLSTALRTDAYTSARAGTGTKCVNFPSAPCVDDNVGIPLRVQMNCGMYYDVNIKKAEVVDPQTGFVDRNKVMQAIVDDVNAQEGHEIMGCTVHVDASMNKIAGSSAIYFLSGEAFTVVDMPFNDPVWSDYSAGIAAQMGIHGGITSNLAKTEYPIRDSESLGDAMAADFRDGTIRFENLGHSVEIDVSETDTVKDVMDRLRSQAGEWLYVNYYDEHMGQTPPRNSGDYPLISISSVDGSAVSIIDVKGHIAQDALGISTGIQTRLNADGTGDGIMDDTNFVWDMSDPDNFPATELTITVAGYSHTIDLTEIRNVTSIEGESDTRIQADDVARFINARMQDYDVRAEVNEDKELMLWSMRGYSLEVKFEKDGTDVTSDFMGDETSLRSYYRGGYNLDGDATTRGIDNNDFYQYGIHSQNATIRSGANTMRQNGFGVINDVIAAIESGNRDNLADKLLPKIDDFISNILSVMSENGALQARYEYNGEKLTQESAIMTESYDDLVKIDPADAISQLMVADYMYQANLAVISRLIQPTLLDFLH